MGQYDRSQNMGPNCGIFWRLYGLSVTVQNFSGVVCVNLCIKWLLGMHWAGNGFGLRVH